MKLSILICTIAKRYAMLGRLKTELYSQILPYAETIEVLVNSDSVKTIGQKRNELLDRAIGDYLCFIDDDDWISPDYIKLLMTAIDSGCDCASLRGEYSSDGKLDGIFEHSLKYSEWRTTGNNIKYERFPNHLNLIKSSIAKQFKFPEIQFGEDHAWSRDIHEAGVLKTEYHIDEIIYHYRFISNKNNVFAKS